MNLVYLFESDIGDGTFKTSMDELNIIDTLGQQDVAFDNLEDMNNAVIISKEYFLYYLKDKVVGKPNFEDLYVAKSNIEDIFQDSLIINFQLY